MKDLEVLREDCCVTVMMKVTSSYSLVWTRNTLEIGPGGVCGHLVRKKEKKNYPESTEIAISVKHKKKDFKNDVI